MSDEPLPFGKDRRPEYPEVESRDYLNKREKAELVLSQGGRCAGCGIKPKAWEYDHDKALWKGDTNQSDLKTWQAFGSRTECGCHAKKTAEEANERAKMRRLRMEKGQQARRKANGPQIKSRPTKWPKRAIKSRGFEFPSKWGRAGAPKRSWPKRKFGSSSRLKKGQA